MAFVFPTDDALHFALTGGLIPPEVSLASAEKVCAKSLCKTTDVSADAHAAGKTMM